MRKKTKVTLQDIASRANLSVSAVSLALRDHPSISDESKRRIHELRQEMGYRSNDSFSRPTTPANPRTPLRLAYCVIGESLQDPAYVPVVHGIIRASRDWQAQLAIEQMDKGVPKKSVLMPTGESPTGYLLTGFLTDAVIDHFAQENKPIIALGQNVLTRKVSSVRPDMFMAAKIVAERAIADGYKNFVHIAANLTSLHNSQFLQFCRLTLLEHGYSLNDDHVITASEIALHDPKYLDILQEKLSGQPTAILTPGERTASTCASILYAKGLMEKKNLSIYCLRSSDAGENNPLFESLNLGAERLGQIAVDRMVQKILNYQAYKEDSVTMIAPQGWLDDSAAHTTAAASAVSDMPRSPSLPETARR